MTENSTPLIMGIVNVTPDSFSDGGQFLDIEAAISHGMELIAEGADIVDVGGESTRSGALAVDEATEIARVVPVVEALSPHVRVSVDTTKPAVAAAAAKVGATLLNDVSGALAGTAAELKVGWVAMHRRGTPETMQSLTNYDDIVSEVAAHLADLARNAEQLGVKEIWIDPGVGFAKNTEGNLALLAHLEQLVGLGWPVLVGTSRKTFLGHILAASDTVGAARGARSKHANAGLIEPKDVAVAMDDRLEGSIAAVTWTLAKGASMVRVHDVSAAVAARAVVVGSI